MVLALLLLGVDVGVVGVGVVMFLATQMKLYQTLSKGVSSYRQQQEQRHQQEQQQEYKGQLAYLIPP
jgi:hypothetical protein